MLLGKQATVLRGYTGYDHLIDNADENAATDAIAGIEFRRASDALRAAIKAFSSICHPRVRLARVTVSLITAHGYVIEVG